MSSQLDPSVPEKVRRFGDRTPPVVPGKYEFFGKRDGRHLGAKNIEVYVIEEWGSLYIMEGIPWSLSLYEGMWWGPYPDSLQGDNDSTTTG